MAFKSLLIMGLMGMTLPSLSFALNCDIDPTLFEKNVKPEYLKQISDVTASCIEKHKVAPSETTNPQISKCIKQSAEVLTAQGNYLAELGLALGHCAAANIELGKAKKLLDKIAQDPSVPTDLKETAQKKSAEIIP